MDFNLFELFYELLVLLGRWSTNLYSWLFTPVTIGSVEFVPFWSIGGGVVITLLVLYLIKVFVPLA